MPRQYARAVSAAAALVALIISGVQPASAQSSYTLIDLGTLGGPESFATAINSNGWVIGQAQVPSEDYHAFVYSGGSMMDLTPGYMTSTPVAINANNQIIGNMIDGAGVQHAFFFDSAGLHDLGTLGGRSSAAKALNASGVVAGDSAMPNGATHGFLWDGVMMRDLGTLGGRNSHARFITASGVIVGDAEVASADIHAFLYSGGTMRDLGTLGGANSFGFSANELGQVIGNSETSVGTTHAFFYDGSTMRDLGTLGGRNSSATAMNSSGMVIGRAQTASGQTHAFLWDGVAMRDLSLGGSASFPFGINASGQVVGFANRPDGSFHAFFYDGANMIDLGTLGGPNSFGLAINDSGHVLGIADTATGESHAFIFDGTMHDLGTLGGGISYADSINANGFSGGYAALPNGLQHAVAFMPPAPPLPADTTPPVSTAALNPAPNAAGWNNADAIVSLSATDDDSGVKQITYSATGAQNSASTAIDGDSATLTISAEGTTTITYYATDMAGNSEVAKTVVVNLDKTAPTLSASTSPAANANGWYNAPVTVTFDASDVLSGMASSPQPVTLSSEGANQSATGEATDKAGNSASKTVDGINIDMTAPSTSASLCGTQGNNGWWLGTVGVALTAQDALSGVAKTCYRVDGGAPQSYSGKIKACGAGEHVVEFWSEDKAGNAEARHTVSFKIDGSGPKVTVEANPSVLSPPNGKMVPVTICGRVTDAQSGVNGSSVKFVVKDSMGLIQPCGSVTVGADGKFSFKVCLEAKFQQQPHQDRVYTIIVSASDMAGNTDKASDMVRVCAK